MEYKKTSITNKTNNLLISNHAMIADNFIKRLLGLIPFREIPQDSGMLLTPCNSIHMLFMRFPIDAVFIDKSNKVCAIYENLTPWIGITKIHSNAISVLELPAGTIKKSSIMIGDTLEIHQ